MAKTSHFERLYYCVKVPAYNSSVKFENYGSALKYLDDLESKGIRYQLKPSTMNLREFIRQQWESDQHAADDLGVSLRTIKNWMALNPTGILKHSTQIVAMQKVEPLELFDAVARNN